MINGFNHAISFSVDVKILDSASLTFVKMMRPNQHFFPFFLLLFRVFEVLEEVRFRVEA